MSDQASGETTTEPSRVADLERSLREVIDLAERERAGSHVPHDEFWATIREARVLLIGGKQPA